MSHFTFPIAADRKPSSGGGHPHHSRRSSSTRLIGSVRTNISWRVFSIEALEGEDEIMAVAIITGAAGLIGSQAARFFHDKGFSVVGIDNDLRSYFFGPDASTLWNRQDLEHTLPN